MTNSFGFFSVITNAFFSGFEKWTLRPENRKSLLLRAESLKCDPSFFPLKTPFLGCFVAKLEKDKLRLKFPRGKKTAGKERRKFLPRSFSGHFDPLWRIRFPSSGRCSKRTQSYPQRAPLIWRPSKYDKEGQQQFEKKRFMPIAYNVNLTCEVKPKTGFRCFKYPLITYIETGFRCFKHSIITLI